MRWLKSRPADVTDIDPEQEMALEPVENENVHDNEETPEAADQVDESDHDDEPTSRRRGITWPRAIAYGALPGLALSGVLAGGFLKWQDGVARNDAVARSESVRAATDSTIAMLSYKPDTVDKDLGSAGDRLTGHFRDSYASLVNEVVIPGAKQKRISAVATVPAAASASLTGNHAVVLVFVNQTTVIGNDPPTNTASSVRVTLDKIGQRWLISDFTPV
jgi:Mce-associated membrane protein